MQLLQLINPYVTSTLLSNARCYAIRCKYGFKFLVEKGITTPNKATIENIVKEHRLGELNVNKNFLEDGKHDTTIKKGNSKQCHSVTFFGGTTASTKS
jgi:hypothetical protein